MGWGWGISVGIFPSQHRLCLLLPPSCTPSRPSPGARPTGPQRAARQVSAPERTWASARSVSSRGRPAAAACPAPPRAPRTPLRRGRGRARPPRPGRAQRWWRQRPGRPLRCAPAPSGRSPRRLPYLSGERRRGLLPRPRLLPGRSCAAAVGVKVAPAESELSRRLQEAGGAGRGKNRRESNS